MRFKILSPRENLLGLRSSGTVSNMSVSIFAWIAQFAVESFKAVTRIEYRWATVSDSRSTGISSVSTYTIVNNTGMSGKREYVRHPLQ